jgi:hypothetical protein
LGLPFGYFWALLFSLSEFWPATCSAIVLVMDNSKLQAQNWGDISIYLSSAEKNLKEAASIAPGMFKQKYQKLALELTLLKEHARLRWLEEESKSEPPK